jgi:hypothetical protein
MHSNLGKFFSVFKKSEDEDEMAYDVIAVACEKLDYRDKLRLAQMLLQRARNEEEEENPKHRIDTKVDELVSDPADPNGNVKTGSVTKKPKTKAKPKAGEALKPKPKQKAEEGDTVGYVATRVFKLRPVKKTALVNSIKAMFQLQGGISEEDVENIITEMESRNLITIEENKVTYVED